MTKSNTTTFILVGAALVAVYFITKKPSAPLPVAYNPYGNPYALPSTPAPVDNTAGIITAAGSAISKIFDNINFGGTAAPVTDYSAV